MSAKKEIVCDGCGEDITYTGNCEDYRLVLGYESKSPWYTKDGGTSGAVTAMHIPKPLDGVKHFCGKYCLKVWTEKSL